MDTEFPSNSQNVVGKSQKKEKPGKNVEKIVEGEVLSRPKPLGRKFKDIFFGGDVKGAAKYITMDVLLPAFKNMIVDATTKGVERVVYGDARPRSRFGGPGGGPKMTYNLPIDRSFSSRQPAMLPHQPPHYSTARYQGREIILANRIEAEAVLEMMANVIETFEVVTVADLSDLVGLPHTYVDNSWGWSNISQATVRQIREGYLLDLPSPEPVK